MADLDEMEETIIKVMKDFGATKDTSIKTADDIAKKCNRPKGMINNKLMGLVQKGKVKRVVREKASGYFVI